MIYPPKHYIVFDGKNLADWGLHLSGTGVFNSPERDIDTVEVPGRDGDLSFDNGRFKNVSITYTGSIIGDDEYDFIRKMQSLRSYVSSRIGYKRLEDTYHPEEFRLAQFTEGFDVDEVMLQGGEFDLEFDCKPQRFLKTGEETLVFTASGSFFNDTFFPAKPLIRVYGSGQFFIGDYGVTVTKPNNVDYVDVDSDMQDCYCEAQNCNSSVVLSLNKFPVLEPGENKLSIGSGITQINITPRWYVI